MREILFRAKRLTDQKWAYGDFTEVVGDCPRILSNENATMYAVAPETIGQYTGLTDKNGKKIFEGDIIRVEHDLWHGENKKTRESDIGVVIYNTNTAEFGAKIHGYCNCLTLRRWKGDFNEVIGNIYDNKLEDFENGC